MNKATSCLKTLPSLLAKREGQHPVVMFLPEGVDIEFDDESQKVKTNGLGPLDKYKKDLIEIVVIENVLDARYTGLGVYMPRTLAEGLPVIPTHVTAQAVFFTVAEANTGVDIRRLKDRFVYDIVQHDQLWIEPVPPESISEGEILIVMNRRVGGWDGSVSSPVIELLCAGGHVPVYWDNETNNFKSALPQEALTREIKEEVGLQEKDFDLIFLGGFHNSVTSELVVLYGAFVDWQIVMKMQANSYGNLSENIHGLYIGSFDSVIRRYTDDARSFAGGERAKATNFPLQAELMTRVNTILNERYIKLMPGNSEKKKGRMY